jgi:deoxycytidylate deaminase
MLINAKVSRVVYSQSYPDDTALKFLAQAGVKVTRQTERV